MLPITFDLGVTGLVYLLARPEKAGLRAFQYACTPIAIFVSAVHGQMERCACCSGSVRSSPCGVDPRRASCSPGC